MEQVLSGFSSNLADLVERAAKSAVGIEARHRLGSSGFVWRPDVIVTASHAIRRQEEIPVVLPDGSVGSAELVGRDADTDIAALRISGVSGVPFTPASAPRTGELVVSVGRHKPGPLALVGAISTAGGPWRTWRGGHIDSLLRLDIGAYHRSSGSAVIDTQGRLAGMLTTGLTRTAPIAIPAATIERVVNELLVHGRVSRGYLGIGLQTILLPAALATALGREQRTGVIVLSVEPDGPAEKGGIHLGDVIVEVGGQVVEDTSDLQSALRGKSGQEVSVIVFRSGVRTELKVKAGERRG